MLQAVAMAQQAGAATIVISLIISIVAKKAIAYIWVFFAGLQVMILLTVNNGSL